MIRSRLARPVRTVVSGNAKIIVVAMVTAALTVAAPTMASSVVALAKNALKLNGKQAVSYTTSAAARRGKLVATNSAGLLPSNILAANAFVHYAHVVTVQAGGTATANGTALITAMTNITTASAATPYLIVLEPGSYDLGAQALTMKTYVSLMGAGADETTITSSGQNVAGSDWTAVEAAPNSTLSYLRVNVTGGTTGDGWQTSAVRANGVTTTLRHVRLSADGAVYSLGGTAGIRAGIRAVAGANVTIEDSMLDAHNGYWNAPVDMKGPGSVVTVTGSQLLSTGAGITYYGVLMESSAASTVNVRNSSITADDVPAQIEAGNTLRIADTMIANVTLNPISNSGGTLSCVGDFDDTYSALDASCA